MSKKKPEKPEPEPQVRALAKLLGYDERKQKPAVRA